LKRHYLAGYIQARKDFFTKVLDGAGDVVDGAVNDAEDAVTGAAEGIDALGNGIVNAVNQRDYQAGNIQARKDFFTKVLDGAGDVVDGTVNDAEDAVSGAAEGFDALGNGIKNAVNQRDYQAGNIQARKDFFTKVLDGAGDVVDGTVNDAEDAVSGAAEGFDALGNGIKNAVNQ
jgi:ABC-type transporter Mla subunit MlaD